MLRSSLFCLVIVACSASSPRTTFDDGSGTDGGPSPGDLGDASAPTDAGVDATVTTETTVYANTDDTLYAVDPATQAIKKLGTFSGQGNKPITDCAVNEAGDVYLVSETTLYKAALPAGGGTDVALTKVSDISVQGGQKFYALAFTPAGVLGAGEGLVGGDNTGELWSIDPSTGAIKDLGSFGKDGSRFFALSGDVVFYKNAAGAPTGLATIRSCQANGNNCTTTNDYLAGVDVAAMTTAFNSGTPASSLLEGIYGGSSSSKGPGIGSGSVFGLGAWEGKVFGFTRNNASGGPRLLAIDPTSGAGSTSGAALSFTNGWSGAGVTTKVTVTVPPPPPAPN